MLRGDDVGDWVRLSLRPRQGDIGNGISKRKGGKVDGSGGGCAKESTRDETWLEQM